MADLDWALDKFQEYTYRKMFNLSEAEFEGTSAEDIQTMLLVDSEVKMEQKRRSKQPSQPGQQNAKLSKGTKPWQKR